MPVCPWSVLISWERPNLSNGQQIKGYVLSGSVNATITSADQYIFYYNDTKVIPGEEFKVTLTVNFEGGAESSSVTKNVRIPAPRKFGKILLINAMKTYSMTLNKGLKSQCFCTAAYKYTFIVFTNNRYGLLVDLEKCETK